MLICHPYQFIFIKPIKAAGTSVECFLQPLCQGVNDDICEYSGEQITPQGIVGYRGPTRGTSQYWNHMSSARIQHLHPDWFSQYSKVSIVRNPYQKAISLFLWLGPLTHARAIQFASINKQQLQNLFLLFLKTQRDISTLLNDSPRLLLNGDLVVDQVLRFESIRSDLSSLITNLSLPLSIDNLGVFKVSGRVNQSHDARSFFCEESLDLVNGYFDWYFTFFDYARCDSISFL